MKWGFPFWWKVSTREQQQWIKPHFNVSGKLSSMLNFIDFFPFLQSPNGWNQHAILKKEVLNEESWSWKSVPWMKSRQRVYRTLQFCVWLCFCAQLWVKNRPLNWQSSWLVFPTLICWIQFLLDMICSGIMNRGIHCSKCPLRMQTKQMEFVSNGLLSKNIADRPI